MTKETASISTFVIFCLLMLALGHTTVAQGGGPPKFFDVKTYGAMADGKTDNSMAILKAWNEACEWNGKSRVWIGEGTYMLNSVVLKGPCMGEMAFVIKGVLKAPTDPNLFFTDHWIAFQYVDGLVVKGGGSLDGQGSSAWHFNDCFTNSHCNPLPVTMRFDFVNNARIHHLRSINSKNAHFNIFACNNMNMSHIRISAPQDSPNTDGIKIGSSANIRIKRTVIGTGDDCISMVSGTRQVNVSKVWCGPGHGISVGSLGKSQEEEPVTGITIRNCTLAGTQNGVRIKTWAQSFAGSASDFVFEDIRMDDVNNPIIIDQQYCPVPNCDVN
ncbi:galacturonan 1,4-alpha-galacturonidase, partial [Sarracenia purpurea var. burkii]